MKTYNSIFVLILFVLFGLSVTEADAQKRRKKTRRAARTQTTRVLPSSQIIEPQVISTADETADETSETNPKSTINPTRDKTPAAAQKATATMKTGTKTTATDGVRDLQMLSQAEERAENFRRQLTEVMSKEGELNSKLETIDDQMRPENIERETAIYGSTRPEEVRESRRKMLEKEKTRLRDQITQIQTSRVRLEAAIVTADALVEKLKARVEAEPVENRVVTTTQKSDESKTSDDSDDENSNPQ